MIILRLLPEQIMQLWEPIKTCIQASLPPHALNSVDGLVYIQEQLLLGSIQCWLGQEANSNMPCVIATTQIVHDPASNMRNLLIYTVTAIANHSQTIWTEALKVMREFALSNQCVHIIAYSNQLDAIAIVESLGGDASWRLMTITL